jgi:hypothetical protein
LNLLSEHTSIPQKTISFVLNQSLDKSFSEFVNEYRIEAFKEKILQPETTILQLLALHWNVDLVHKQLSLVCKPVNQLFICVFNTSQIAI